MIINIGKKYVVMRPAKTGSTTLFELINKQTEYRFMFYTGHLPAAHLTEEMKTTLDTYAFYRDPYTRFVSAWQSLLGTYRIQLQNKKPGLLKVLQNIKDDPCLTQNDITPEVVDGISVEDMLRICFALNIGAYGHQHSFYTPSTILFSYENYENNVRDLLNRLGLNSSVDIPRRNMTYNQGVYEKITSEEKRMIVDCYKQDYEYFASRGIYFKYDK